jgi:hypothetical protein
MLKVFTDGDPSVDNFERVKKMQSSDDILYELIQKL